MSGRDQIGATSCLWRAEPGPLDPVQRLGRLFNGSKCGLSPPNVQRGAQQRHSKQDNGLAGPLQFKHEVERERASPADCRITFCDSRQPPSASVLAPQPKVDWLADLKRPLALPNDGNDQQDSSGQNTESNESQNRWRPAVRF